MSDYFDVIGVSSDRHQLKNYGRDEDVKIKTLNMTRKISPIKDLISLMQMIVFFSKEKPQIVHTHTPKAGIIGMLAAWICRVPIRLHTVAGLPLMQTSGMKKKLLIFVERLTYLCGTRIYPNSFELMNYIKTMNLAKSSKLKVIGYGSSNGIDTDFFNPSKKYPENFRKKYKLHGRFVYSYVGRIVADKGINELIFAFDKLSKNYSNITLLLVGPLEDDLDPISSESKEILKENKNILSIGFVKDVRPYLKYSDVFVLPSHREGFPNVLLQACSMNIPCIATNINGCNEIITNNHNGLLIKPKERKDLYDAMERYLLDKDLKNKLSIASRKEIIEKYERKNFHRLLLQEYMELLKL